MAFAIGLWVAMQAHKNIGTKRTNCTYFYCRVIMFPYNNLLGVIIKKLNYWHKKCLIVKLKAEFRLAVTPLSLDAYSGEYAQY